jgi:hypothetical protein
MKILALCIILASSVGAATIASQDDLARVAITQGQGFADSGEKFGITIGENIRTADRTLVRRGLALSRRSNGGNCYGRDYEPRYELYVYLDATWRHGSVCVSALRGRVVSISWFYHFLSP